MDHAIEVHPWDLAEEGTERALAQVAALGVQRISLTAAYPGGRLLRPRAAAEKLYFPERSVVYYRPDKARWADSPLGPRGAELVLVEDYFDTLPIRARREGMTVEARFVLLPYTPPVAPVVLRRGEPAPIGGRAPHEKLYARNAFGDDLVGYLCPSREEVRAYIVRLVDEITRYDVSSVSIEACGFPAYRVAGIPGAAVLDGCAAAEFLLGVCFCDACRARAEAEGIETSPLAWHVRNFVGRMLSGEPGDCPDIDEGPEALADIDGQLPEYVRLRCQTVGSMVSDVRAALRAEVRLVAAAGSRYPAAGAWREGCDVERLAEGADEVRLNDGAPDAEALLGDLAVAHERAGQKAAVSVRLRPGPPWATTYEAFAERVSVARNLGAEGVTFAGYGELALAHLKWIPRVTGA